MPVTIFISKEMIRFYSPDIETDPMLPESDSQHAVRVLRMKEGDELEITDGKGYIYKCRMINAHHKRAMVEIIEKTASPLCWKQNITIAVAPTKHLDRMEWLVEKLVEIGVNDIVPIKCRFSERKEIKTERLEKIAVSAMKQSLKAVMPYIHDMMPFEKAIIDFKSRQNFIAFCAEDIPKVPFAKAYQPGQDTTILIGPEGDFSSQEVENAFAIDYKPVTLGDNRLRTETAALYSCSACHVIDSLLE